MKNMLAIVIVVLSFLQLLGFDATPINTENNTYNPSPTILKKSINNKGFLKPRQNMHIMEENNIIYNTKDDAQEMDTKNSSEKDERPNARQSQRNRINDAL